ncbi:hypothetical protein ACOSP7_030042 [Xanthoceras sorbifolium]
MASLISHLLLLFMFLQFQQHYCFSMPTANNVPKLIDQVCTKSKYHNFCIQYLAAAPGAATADLKTLDDFSLKSTAADVSTNQAYINSQLPNVKDPKVKQVLNHCKINYDGSQASLQLAIGSLAANNFAAVDMYGEMAWENMNDCARVIKQGPPPPGLPGRNAKTLQLIDVTMVISNMLVPYQL